MGDGHDAALEWLSAQSQKTSFLYFCVYTLKYFSMVGSQSLGNYLLHGITVVMFSMKVTVSCKDAALRQKLVNFERSGSPYFAVFH